MAELYDIDLVRAIFTHKINDSVNYFLTSFYEQIGDPSSQERYGELLVDLISDQNKADYLARGVVYQNGEADIVNITSNYICPLEYGVRLDVALENRDAVNAKVLELINSIKGRKFDLILGELGDIYVCEAPVINYTTGQLEVGNNVYMVYGGANTITDTSKWATIAAELVGTGKVWVKPATQLGVNATYTLYIESASKLYECVLTITFNGGSSYIYALTSVDEIEDTFTKYKVSLSINNSQKTEPFINNSTERIAILLSGQATIVDSNIMLGNDKIITRIAGYVVEPIEMPSGSKLGDTGNQIVSSTFPKPTTYNASVENTISFTFNVVKNNALIMAWYNLARKQTIASPVTSIDLTYTILEYDYQFGVLTIDTITCKLDDLSIVNTNGDVLTIKTSFKLGAY